jgi:hypothetical protein
MHAFNRDGYFRRLAQVEGNNLQIISQFIIRKLRFEPAAYPALREFYDRVAAAHTEQIVLKCETASKNSVKQWEKPDFKF